MNLVLWKKTPSRVKLMLGLMIFSAVFTRLFFWHFTHRTWEDALITTLHSENFYSGLGITHFRIDDPRPLHGFTSPISLLIPMIGDFFGVGDGLVFQKICSIIASCIAVVYAYLILSQIVAPRVAPAAAVLCCGYLALEHHQVLWGMAGMETTCVVAILLASMYYLLAEKTIPFAVTLGICIYARPDFVLWDIIAWVFFSVHAAANRKWIDIVKVVVIAVAVYVPWLVFTISYYGSPVPNTIIAKSLGYPIWWETNHDLPQVWDIISSRLTKDVFGPLGPSFGGNGTGFAPLPTHNAVQALMAIAILTGFVFAIIKRQAKTAPIYVFVAVFAAYEVFAVPVVFGWYAIPIAAVSSVLVAKGVGDLAMFAFGQVNRQRNAPILAALVMSVLLLVPFVSVLPVTFRGEKNIQRFVENPIRKQIGIDLSKIPLTSTIGGEPLGYISYFSRRTYYDYPGLCSRLVVQTLRELQSKCAHCHMFLQVMEKIQPDYLVLRRGEYVAYSKEYDGRFLKHYGVVKWYTISDENKSKLLMPQNNIDDDFVLLKKDV